MKSRNRSLISFVSAIQLWGENEALSPLIPIDIATQSGRNQFYDKQALKDLSGLRANVLEFGKEPLIEKVSTSEYQKINKGPSLN